MNAEGQARRYAATFPADPATVTSIRGEVAAVAAQCGFSEVQLYDVRIAVSEIVTNAVLHAYADRDGEIRVTATWSAGELKVVISDDGPGMAPRIGSPGLGLGLPAAATAASDLTIVTPKGGGTQVHLTFRRQPCAGKCGAESR